MRVIAIDPGTEQSAFVVLRSDGSLEKRDLQDNRTLVSLLRDAEPTAAVLAVEMIASYGMPVGRETFETCVWIGRFIEAWGGPHELVYRREVKLHLCNSSRAKDANVRQALLDRYGPGREKAMGRKAEPGPLYGVRKDIWSALGVGVTFLDRVSAGRDVEAIGA